MPLTLATALRRMDSAGHTATVRDIKNACRILAGNSKRKIRLRRFKTSR
jgi:hypothetical protein